jgi:hypothetical protein
LLVGGRAGAADEEAEIRARAREKGIGELGTSRTKHYLLLGNAPQKFRERALEICEGLARDYLTYFKERKFPVAPPKDRLTVLAFAGKEPFATFLGEKPGTEAGRYELGTNRLVIFDNRGRAELQGAQEKANTIVLVHEAMHQLTFNTGLLERAGDVPHWLSEGLAMFAEVRSPDGRAVKVGDANAGRVSVLAEATSRGAAWLPLVDLLTDDRLFEQPETEQMAYAQAWTLVHALVKTRTAAFRSYLDRIRPRRAATSRVDDVTRTLGPLDALDRDLGRYANRLAERLGFTPARG